jgi:hypothetical protein
MKVILFGFIVALVSSMANAAFTPVSFSEPIKRAVQTGSSIPTPSKKLDSITISEFCHADISFKSSFYNRCPMDYVMTGIISQNEQGTVIECGRIEVICR